MVLRSTRRGLETGSLFRLRVSHHLGRARFRPKFVFPVGRVGDWRAGLGRSLCSLLARSFVCECHTISAVPRFQPPPRRTQHADFPHCALLFASPAAGAKAIAVDEATASESMGEQRANHPISVNPKPEPVSDPAGIDRPNSNVASTPTSPRGGTKIAQVIELLQRGDGATLAELVAATGWLPHTTRAALTGLRKRGYAVGIDRADKVRGPVYRIEPTEMEEDNAAPHAEASQTCEAVIPASNRFLIAELSLP